MTDPGDIFKPRGMASANLAVQHTPELERILRLPVRTAVADTYAWTRWAKRPGADPEALLFDVQAEGLAQCMAVGGLFGPIAVGNGKTLLSGLLPTLMRAKRPLLLQPASLIDKTRNELATLSATWFVHPGIQIRSYEVLGTHEGQRTLDLLDPDFLLLDEAHKAKDLSRARVKKIARFMKQKPTTLVAVLSGTVAKEGIRDFGHLLIWALKSGAPIPLTRDELDQWANALDFKTKPGARQPVGALSKFAGGSHDLATVRRAFHARLESTPGVVFSKSTGIDCSIEIKEVLHKVNPATVAAFEQLRTKWITPDGWYLSEAVEVWAKARQLAVGLSYYPDPRPDDVWLDARKGWGSHVRNILSRSRSLDSEKQVKLACLEGRIEGAELLRAWEAAWARFRPNQLVYWLDRGVLEKAATYLENEKGIVWVEHTEFGFELSRMTGAPYFGEQGKDLLGNSIEQFKGGPCIASINANKEGRNLQDRWHKGFIVSPMANHLAWEQLIARYHRPGQKADCVEIQSLVSCWEHANALPISVDGAKGIGSDLMGGKPKILLADRVLLSPFQWPKTAAFTETKRKEKDA